MGSGLVGFGRTDGHSQISEGVISMCMCVVI